MAGDGAATEAGHGCQSCGLEFRDEALIREHYKSELHLYNLRRRSAGLAPVEAALFARKQAAAARAVAARTAEASAESTTFSCPFSRKVFKSKPQFDQYQRSKKYLQLKAKAEAAAAGAAQAAEASAADCEGEASASGTGGSVATDESGSSIKDVPVSRSDGEAPSSAASASASSARKEPEWDAMTVFTHCMFDNTPVEGLAE